MSESKIYEIAQMMNDEKVIKSDFSEAADLVYKLFRDKYVNRLESEVSKHVKKKHESPSKEVLLMKSLRNFMDESKHKSIDKMIDDFIMYETLLNLQGEVKKPAANAPARPSVKAAEVPAKPTVRAAEAPSKAPEIKTASVEAEDLDSAIHKDGVYEYDPDCLTVKSRQAFNPMTGFLMLCALGSINPRM